MALGVSLQSLGRTVTLDAFILEHVRIFGKAAAMKTRQGESIGRTWVRTRIALAALSVPCRTVAADELDYAVGDADVCAGIGVLRRHSPAPGMADRCTIPPVTTR